MTTRIRSRAKINLGLAIGPVRGDGYHALATIYQTLAAHDFVEVTARALPGGASRISVSSNDFRVPCDERNTCWKMMERALAHWGIAAEVAVHIEKRLPVQGGLGAGSANAAAALIGLERELGRTMGGGERLEMAAAVGSDVPLFLIGGTVLGLGRGEEVYPLPDLPETGCVLAMPEVGVSTPQAFRDWDDGRGTGAAKLTGAAGSDRLKQLGRMWAAALSGVQELHANATGVFRADAKKDRAGNLLLELVRTGIGNDFERVVFPQYPSLRDILEILKNDSDPDGAALYAALSGSGSALFGLYESEAATGAAMERLARRGVAGCETRTMGRAEYWREMMVE